MAKFLFKPGDRVRVKTWNWFFDNSTYYRPNGDLDMEGTEITFKCGMTPFTGLVFEVEESFILPNISRTAPEEKCYYLKGTHHYTWKEEWLERI